MKTAIIFDLDGTLLDTLGDLHAATNHVLAEFGYPARSIGEVCSFVGNGAEQLIRQAVPAGVDHKPVLAAFQSWYAAHCDILTAPYPGIPEVLATLEKDFPLAVVSNKPDRAVKELAKIYFPTLYARGESADCPRKPAPDMVRMAMAALGADHCIYVGDSEVDILTAKNMGVPCVCVTWGFRGEDALLAAGGQYLCRLPADLPQTLQTVFHAFHSSDT